MKQVAILLLFIGWLCSCNSKADAQTDTIKNDTLKYQSSVADSFAYMKEIVANKQKYIGQPLSVLLKDLKIPVKSYYPNCNTGGKISYMSISFDDDTTTMKKRFGLESQKWIGLYIEWNPYLSVTEDWTLLGKGAEHEWNAVEQKYYATKVVGDIIMGTNK